ncbi:hypothetical protein [Candidatus Frankia alpina]|uniref:hypothetical protein n=1 Tax=Candidatus Frankia alpina TaxID=2699483 RepID=UPI001A9A02A9|nr:hypothetical protein [Candidatus Frankia alpina]
MTEQTTEQDQGGQVLAGPWVPAIDPAPTDTPAPPVQGEVLPARPVAPSTRTGVADPLRVPAWVTSRRVARARARHAGRVAGRVAVRSTWRGPAAVLRGSWRAGRFWWS